MKTVNHELEVYATWRGISGTNAWVFVSVIKPGSIMFLRQWTDERMGNASRVTIAGRTAWHGGPSPEYGDYGTMMQVGSYVVEAYGDSLEQTDQIMTKRVTPLLGPSPSTST